MPFATNPQENPFLIDEAAGDPALMDLLVSEVTAAGELFVDPHNQEKLQKFTSSQEAVMAYKVFQSLKNILGPITN
jgi:hypothetical protein